MGYFRVYPNLYLILVGPAGFRKTGALDIARDLLRTSLPDIPFSAEAQTKESIIQEMSKGTDEIPYSDPKLGTIESSPYIIAVTELSQFLGPQPFHMVDFLTTIYDRTGKYYDYKTRSRGEERINGPYLNLMGCTVPDYIQRGIKSDTLAGGFARRAIFIYEDEEAKRVAFPVVTEEMAKCYIECQNHLKEIAKLDPKPFELEKDAMDFYVDWYEKLVIPDDILLAGWARSKHIQLFKVAMLYSVAQRLNKKITLSDLEWSLDLLDLIESNYQKVFSGSGRNELSGIADQILNTIEKVPTKMLPEPMILRKFFSDADTSQIMGILAHLVQTQQLKRIKVKNISFYKLPDKN